MHNTCIDEQRLNKGRTKAKIFIALVPHASHSCLLFPQQSQQLASNQKSKWQQIVAPWIIEQQPSKNCANINY